MKGFVLALLKKRIQGWRGRACCRREITMLTWTTRSRRTQTGWYWYVKILLTHPCCSIAGQRGITLLILPVE